jgi:hypothetical protein
MTADAQLEFRLEFVDALADLRQAARDLRAFNLRHDPAEQAQ